MYGDRLEKLRIAKGLTRKEVASILRIHESTYGKYELNKREPDFKMTIGLADFYNVSIDYLLGRSDEPWPKPSSSTQGTAVPPIAQVVSQVGVTKPKNVKAIEKYIESLAHVESREKEIEEMLLHAEMSAKRLAIESGRT